MKLIKNKKINNIKSNKRHKKFNFKIFLQNEFSKKRIIEYLIILAAALLCTVSYDYFIAPTTSFGLFPVGVAAFARAISILISQTISTQNLYYFIFLFLFNFPLFIFGSIKIG